MAKLTLSNFANLSNETSTVTQLNANNDAIEAALENTLSRNGATPNQMENVLDMNSYKIINLGAPVNNSDAARLIDLTNLVGSLSDAAAAAVAAAVAADIAARSIIASVATRTVMKGLGAIPGTAVFLTEAGREGIWILTATDYSTEAAVDTAEGMIAVDDVSGYWLRYSPSGACKPTWFGAVGDNTTNDRTAIDLCRDTIYALNNKADTDNYYMLIDRYYRYNDKDNAWSTGQNYSIGDVLYYTDGSNATYDERYYTALTNHLSGTFTTDLTNEEWVILNPSFILTSPITIKGIGREYCGIHLDIAKTDEGIHVQSNDVYIEDIEISVWSEQKIANGQGNYGTCVTWGNLYEDPVWKVTVPSVSGFEVGNKLSNGLGLEATITAIDATNKIITTSSFSYNYEDLANAPAAGQIFTDTTTSQSAEASAVELVAPTEVKFSHLKRVKLSRTSGPAHALACVSRCSHIFIEDIDCDGGSVDTRHGDFILAHWGTVGQDFIFDSSNLIETPSRMRQEITAYTYHPHDIYVDGVRMRNTGRAIQLSSVYNVSIRNINWDGGNDPTTSANPSDGQDYRNANQLIDIVVGDNSDDFAHPDDAGKVYSNILIENIEGFHIAGASITTSPNIIDISGNGTSKFVFDTATNERKQYMPEWRNITLRNIRGTFTPDTDYNSTGTSPLYPTSDSDSRMNELIDIRNLRGSLLLENITITGNMGYGGGLAIEQCHGPITLNNVHINGGKTKINNVKGLTFSNCDLEISKYGQIEWTPGIKVSGDANEYWPKEVITDQTTGQRFVFTADGTTAGTNLILMPLDGGSGYSVPTGNMLGESSGLTKEPGSSAVYTGIKNIEVTGEVRNAHYVGANLTEGDTLLYPTTYVNLQAAPTGGLGDDWAVGDVVLATNTGTSATVIFKQSSTQYHLGKFTPASSSQFYLDLTKTGSVSGTWKDMYVGRSEVPAEYMDLLADATITWVTNNQTTAGLIATEINNNATATAAGWTAVAVSYDVNNAFVIVKQSSGENGIPWDVTVTGNANTGASYGFTGPSRLVRGDTLTEQSGGDADAAVPITVTPGIPVDIKVGDKLKMTNGANEYYVTCSTYADANSLVLQVEGVPVGLTATTGYVLEIDRTSKRVQFDNVDMRGGYYNLYLEEADVHLKNCYIHRATGSGIRMTSNSKLVIDGGHIGNNNLQRVVFGSGSGYDIVNADSTSTLVARGLTFDESQYVHRHFYDSADSSVVAAFYQCLFMDDPITEKIGSASLYVRCIDCLDSTGAFVRNRRTWTPKIAMDNAGAIANYSGISYSKNTGEFWIDEDGMGHVTCDIETTGTGTGGSPGYTLILCDNAETAFPLAPAARNTATVYMTGHLNPVSDVPLLIGTSELHNDRFDFYDTATGGITSSVAYDTITGGAGSVHLEFHMVFKI